MPGIANLSIVEFQERINRFDQRYVNDWNGWLNTQPNVRAAQLGIVLRRWQACRPNRMRRIQAEQQHAAPYLEDLITQAAQYLQILQNFDIRDNASFTPQNCNSLVQLWGIFQNLSYHGRTRNGLAGVVGISKAVLLLTDGRVGPAFDSKVRGHLGLGNVASANQWINALCTASRDIQAFEANNQTTLQQAVPQPFAGLQSGRIYDMALGPGG
ncbi:MAG: hypothetical protein KJ893_01260 [Candidatus Omnitrophica bacterium]|nr:hypothetical protein [Candidatus Omnitrophota bacterium]MBU4477674.1 hypothetical protein [Candidatus Omnitrophota bacterium]MCG2703871.1 hypothetical protein [Candidatus Omnitrophota bacterium]